MERDSGNIMKVSTSFRMPTMVSFRPDSKSMKVGNLKTDPCSLLTTFIGIMNNIESRINGDAVFIDNGKLKHKKISSSSDNLEKVIISRLKLIHDAFKSSDLDKDEVYKDLSTSIDIFIENVLDARAKTELNDFIETIEVSEMTNEWSQKITQEIRKFTGKIHTSTLSIVDNINTLIEEDKSNDESLSDEFIEKIVDEIEHLNDIIFLGLKKIEVKIVDYYKSTGVECDILKSGAKRSFSSFLNIRGKSRGDKSTTKERGLLGGRTKKSRRTRKIKRSKKSKRSGKSKRAKK